MKLLIHSQTSTITSVGVWLFSIDAALTISFCSELWHILISSVLITTSLVLLKIYWYSLKQIKRIDLQFIQQIWSADAWMHQWKHLSCSYYNHIGCNIEYFQLSFQLFSISLQWYRLQYMQCNMILNHRIFLIIFCIYWPIYLIDIPWYINTIFLNPSYFHPTNNSLIRLNTLFSHMT